jgi:hypothetical protein
MCPLLSSACYAGQPVCASRTGYQTPPSNIVIYKRGGVCKNIFFVYIEANKTQTKTTPFHGGEDRLRRAGHGRSGARCACADAISKTGMAGILMTRCRGLISYWGRGAPTSAVGFAHYPLWSCQLYFAVLYVSYRAAISVGLHSTSGTHEHQKYHADTIQLT